ncbi:armadillo-type protein [Dimargaris cristalligena]|uniref:Importin subunit alpha n=1 Tax=Dimargaris cristalligena TaxID=215637 RepID=A0A4V1J568_9FUNG|nr:armadillo-type protein [Dimargaris cristalligena]|eukprot:RKP38009.1 armadillo-type protein [Dimargaris cristalligena]
MSSPNYATAQKGPSSPASNNNNNPNASAKLPGARRRSLFKANGMPGSPKEARAHRISQDAHERKRQREQLIMGKRFRTLVDDDYEDSGTESEYESNPSEVAELEAALAGSESECLKGLKMLSSRLISPSRSLEKYILVGSCVPQLMRLIHSPNSEIQLQATWCITNIAAGSAELCTKIMGAVPFLIQSLKANNCDLADQAAWAIGNIAAEGPQFREELAKQGVTPPLVGLLNQEHSSRLTQTVCFALSNLARCPSAAVRELFDADIGPKLMQHLDSHASLDVLKEVFWVLVYITAGDINYAQRLIEEQDVIAALVPQLAKFADQGSAALPLIRTLGNVSAISEATADRVLAFPEILKQLLHWVAESPARTVKKEGLWVLSNLTAGTKTQVNKVLKQDTVAILTQIMGHDAFDIRREAAFSLLNIANHGSDYFNSLNLKALVPAFLDFFKTNATEFVRMALHFFMLLVTENSQGVDMLKSIDGAIDLIESATLLDDEDIRHTTHLLMDRYYNEHIEPEIVRVV